jgi:chemotaxis signal transduction protein
MTLKVYLLTGTKYVSMGAVKYRLYKNGTAALELQSVEPVRDMPPMSPVPRSARDGNGG